MFRSSTILRELVQSLAKVTLLLKHSVKLHHCIFCGDVAVCRETVCVCCLLCRLILSQRPLIQLPEDGRRPKHVGAINMCILI